jgi:hypothetical protein
VTADNSANRSVGLTAGYKVDALEVGYNYAKDNVVGNAISANTVAASYDFGVAKPVFIFQKQKDDKGLDRKIYTLAVSAPVTATGKVLAGFTKLSDLQLQAMLNSSMLVMYMACPNVQICTQHMLILSKMLKHPSLAHSLVA